MSTQEVFPNKNNLSHFFSGSLRINSKAELEEFLSQPGARERVRAIPYQDVFLVIKHVGLADSLEFLSFTTREQRRGLIDLDCWRKDSFHVGSFMEWMAASVESGPEEAARMARAVDPDLLALFLKESIEVYALELDEPSPDLPLIFTPDNRLGLYITADGEKGVLSKLILDSIFRFDPSLGYDVIDRVRRENRVSMEENAYQEKRRRLEEIGFVDYYEALEIYDEGGVQPMSSTAEARPRDEQLEISTTLPALFVDSLSPGHFLLHGLQKIVDLQDVERLRQGLAALANRILSIHSVTPGDLEKVQPALEEIRDTLNIALEHLTGGQADGTAAILRTHDVQALFKIGLHLMADLRSRVEGLLAQERLQLEGCKELLLCSAEVHFLNGVRRLHPLFFEGLKDASKSGYRNFQSLDDLCLARQRLEDIGTLARSFWTLFEERSQQVLGSSLSNCVLDKGEVRFSHIFNTALASVLRGGRPTPELALVGDVETMLKGTHRDRLDEKELTHKCVQRGKQLVLKQAGSELTRDLSMGWHMEVSLICRSR